MSAVKHPKPPADLVSVLIRRLPRSVRDHFKAVCARRGRCMSKEIEKYMRETVARHYGEKT